MSDIEGIFKNICTKKINDGVIYLPESVRVTEMRADANYAGVRVTLLGLIDGARCQIQIDIGFGDAVTPGPENVEYPVMLAEFEAPQLRAYPRYTVVAEKFEALTSLGIANSRMKVYFDLWILSRHTDFDGDILREAVRETFIRRQTALTQQAPFGLTDTFAQDTQKQIQWKAFLRKNQLEALTLTDTVEALETFLRPIYGAVGGNTEFHAHWQAGGPPKASTWLVIFFVFTSM